MPTSIFKRYVDQKKNFENISDYKPKSLKAIYNENLQLARHLEQD